MKRHTWWTIGAGLIAVLELVFSVGLWVDRLTEDRTRDLGNGVTFTVPSEFGPVWGDILLTGGVALAAAAIIAGLHRRNSQPDRSRSLLVAGLAPAALAGVVFFWFPPFWGVSVLAVALIVRVGRDGTGVALTV
jgi:hypothetical protein